ncbi:MAG: hypothetical protein F6J95_023075 [Leptolyngbya sp. SIO1E4]|nr:hypothetical protein [Leptolyngbya sp. SIO1E4]
MRWNRYSRDRLPPLAKAIDRTSRLNVERYPAWFEAVDLCAMIPTAGVMVVNPELQGSYSPYKNLLSNLGPPPSAPSSRRDGSFTTEASTALQTQTIRKLVQAISAMAPPDLEPLLYPVKPLSRVKQGNRTLQHYATKPYSLYHFNPRDSR